MNRKIVISINTSWNIFNFRLGLVKELIGRGYEVIALAPKDEYSSKLEEIGCTFIHLPMDTNGTNPVRDAVLLSRYYAILRSIRPAAFLGFTIKPNIYGSIAAHLLGIPVVNNIAGLGATFISRNYMTRIVSLMYRVALRSSHHVFFQNPDDRILFLKERLARNENSSVIPGSGLNLKNFQPPQPSSSQGRPFRFLLVARMLRDKGIEEFANAARLLRARHPGVDCQLLGFVNAANSNAISMEQLRAWEAEGILRYLGKTEDVRPYLADADCVVLPSYREGVPRSLLEAAAMARPLVATDVAGCREAVDDGSNGLLCKVRDAEDLAAKMTQIVEMSDEARAAMGQAGRRKVEEEFDENIVIQRYLQTLDMVSVPGSLRPNATGLDVEREFLVDG